MTTKFRYREKTTVFERIAQKSICTPEIQSLVQITYKKNACRVCIMLNQAMKLGKAKKLGKEKDHEKIISKEPL